jgi:hypothetical protein
VRRAGRAALLAVALALAGAAPAAAQSLGSQPATTVRPSGTLVEPERYDRPPPGRRLSARQVVAIAEALPVVREVRETGPPAYVRAYLTDGGDWQVSLYTPRGERRDELAQVLVDDRTGRVEEAWTGVQVAWTMARGYPGAFGRAANSPWVWIGLCVLFVLPFLRAPLRWLHLDLAVLLAFSVSYAFFGAANLDVSVPSAYPLLAYLLVRMLAVAAARARALSGAGELRAPPVPLVGPGFLLIGIVFLTGFRVALNVTDGNVIDVGYASVIGADLLAAGSPLYGAFPLDNEHGDTYGPVAYAAYVPFEALWPWSGTWDDLPAAHAAAVAFDLGCALLLWLAGRRLRDHELGLLLAYLWLTFPFTLLVVNSGANDALVALLVLAAFLAAARPAARGALVALAGLTKFAPLALAPLFVSHGARGARTVVASGLAFAAVAALVLAPFDLGTVWERTFAFQQERDSPFSIWRDLPDALQAVAQGAAGLLALAVAVVPRQRDAASLAALAAAVLIALQLAVDHWFYLYLVWFAPLVWIALLSPAPGAAPARSPRPAPAAGSG